MNISRSKLEQIQEIFGALQDAIDEHAPYLQFEWELEDVGREYRFQRVFHGHEIEFRAEKKFDSTTWQSYVDDIHVRPRRKL